MARSYACFRTYCIVLIIVLSSLITVSDGFTTLSKFQTQSRPYFINHCHIKASSVDSEVADYGLPPKLKKYADDLRKVNDDRMRYQQLLFLASKCEKLDDALKTDENKVQGCLSVVHVHATQTDDKIFYKGDSDAQLTKGLVALLVNGLSNCTYDEIQKVKPEFIQYAGIANSLTPGRNNGFLNMLRLMKIKAYELNKSKVESNQSSADNSIPSGSVWASSSSTAAASSSAAAVATSIKSNDGGGKTAESMITKLCMLKPVTLEVINDSAKHAGHVGAANAGKAAGQTHYNVKIVAACFEGLALVQRHKMIYTLLTTEMSTAGGVHALSISAKTPSEAAAV